MPPVADSYDSTDDEADNEPDNDEIANEAIQMLSDSPHEVNSAFSLLLHGN